MLQTQGGPPGFFPPCCEEISDEGLSVLPRHTKVLVTGNNRTKSVLVGLHGVVKKAVGLGGWHWLVLTNGDEVKLQRNALSVIGPPTGHEDDDVDNPFSGTASLDDEDFPRSFKPRVRPRKPTITTMSSAGNTSLASGAGNTSTKESAVPMQQLDKKGDDIPRPKPAALPHVDLSKLETAALKRYRRHFKLGDVGPNSTKEQLLRAVGRHFMSQQLDEVQVLTGFVQAAKRQKV